MIRRLLLWYLPAAAALAAGIVLAIGFFQAMSGSPGERVPPSRVSGSGMGQSNTPGAMRIVALGDSLTRGIGDETGAGYTGDVAEALRRAGRRVEMINLAINGAESADVLTQLERPNVRRVAASADLLLLSVGGNDLTHASAAIVGSGPTAVRNALDTYRRNLSAIMKLLREANPRASICLLGLYNPAADRAPQEAESAAGIFVRLGSETVLRWNAEIADVVAGIPRATEIPVFDLFDGHPERLSADQFHPDRSGYLEIARRVLQALGVETPLTPSK